MLMNATMVSLCRSYERSLFDDIALVIAGSLLIGLSAQVAILLPFSPVPVTFQTFAVLVIGARLGARRGSMCVVSYLIEGAGGLPVFSAGRAGLAHLLGPTGGYLAGFVVAAYITGMLAERGWNRRIWTIVLAMIFGSASIYAFGLLWLSGWVGFGVALPMGLYPFIAGDALKVVLAALFCHRAAEA